MILRSAVIVLQSGRRRSETKVLLTPLFLRTSLHFVDFAVDVVCDFQDLRNRHIDLFPRQSIEFVQGVLDNLLSNQVLEKSLEISL